MDFKVKCVRFIKDSAQQFTVGKVYDVTNSRLVSDTGFVYEAWALKMNGNGDFEALKEWFKKYYDFELVEEKKVFTKKDLKNGDVVKKRNGNVEIIVLPLGTMVTKSNGYNTLAEMNDDLTDIDGDEAYDIVAVRRPSATHECTFGAFEHNLGKLIWNREEKKPLYNGKVVCIDNEKNPTLHTVGKIYQFKDGRLIADNGRVYPTVTPVHSFKEWTDWTGSKFIEIKE